MAEQQPNGLSSRCSKHHHGFTSKNKTPQFAYPKQVPQKTSTLGGADVVAMEVENRKSGPIPWGTGFS